MAEKEEKEEHDIAPVDKPEKVKPEVKDEDSEEDMVMSPPAAADLTSMEHIQPIASTSKMESDSSTASPMAIKSDMDEDGDDDDEPVVSTRRKTAVKSEPGTPLSKSRNRKRKEVESEPQLIGHLPLAEEQVGPIHAVRCGNALIILHTGTEIVHRDSRLHVRVESAGRHALL